MSEDNGAEGNTTENEVKLLLLSGNSLSSLMKAISSGDVSQMLEQVGQGDLSKIEKEVKLTQNFNGCAICGNSEAPTVRFEVEPGRPGAPICESCVEQAIDSFDQAAAQGEQPAFQMTEEIPAPSYIKTQLDEYVVGQDKAKKTLSIAVHNHYKRIINMVQQHVEDKESNAPRIELRKSNVLMIGPTGVGKTLLAETIARTLNVPFAMADATTMTPTGYVGADVESALTHLLMAADGDVEAAERGIVYIDEIDKIALKAGGDANGRDIRGEEVQRALLKILEGKSAMVPVSGDKNASSIPMSTKNILFIVAGAFVGLADIVRSRIEKEQKGENKGRKPKLGFGADFEKKDQISDDDALRQVTPEDLQAYGFIPEFIGRVPVYASMQEHTEESFYKVLTEPVDSIEKECQHQFAMMGGPRLRFEEDALRAIAKMALSRKTGARALQFVIYETLEDVMFEIPDMKDVVEVVVTADNVNKRTKPAYIFAKDIAGGKTAEMAAPPTQSPSPQPPMYG